MKEKEIWKDIPGYEGKYQVSDLGRVKSLSVEEEYYRGNTLVKRKRQGKILKPIKKKKTKYFAISLYLHGELKQYLIHNLVLLTFIGPSNNLVSRHLDGNEENNK